MKGIYQKKIAVSEEMFAEVKKFSDETGIAMSRLIGKAWDNYKESPQYAKIVLFAKDGDTF